MWRRGRDSNPRCSRTPLFESGTINHSDTSPRERISQRPFASPYPPRDPVIRPARPPRSRCCPRSTDRREPERGHPIGPERRVLAGEVGERDGVALEHVLDRRGERQVDPAKRAQHIALRQLGGQGRWQGTPAGQRQGDDDPVRRGELDPRIEQRRHPAGSVPLASDRWSSGCREAAHPIVDARQAPRRLAAAGGPAQLHAASPWSGLIARSGRARMRWAVKPAMVDGQAVGGSRDRQGERLDGRRRSERGRCRRAATARPVIGRWNRPR